jgi:multicomponent Na+:H+ antiporter subunit D
MAENFIDNHLAILPIIVPLAGAAIALLLHQQKKLQAALAFGAMVTAFALSLMLLLRVWSTGKPLVFQMGNWPAPFGITIVGDLLSATMAVMSQLVLCMGMVYARGCRDKCVQYPAFYPLFLTLATGLTGAMLTGDVFNLFVFAELMVISGAVLTAISDDRSGTEAAYKYFYLSVLAAIFLLIASGLLYASYGTLNMADLAQRLNADPGAPLLSMAMVMLMAFFMVKSAIVPFHFWQPDFHAASPTPVSAMLSSVVVKLGVYGFLRMTTLLFVEQAGIIRGILIAFGAIGVIFGGLAAIGTYHAKRMLAYSTIAQIGFILVGLGWGTPLALAAAIVFTFNHGLIKAAMLMLAGAVASRTAVKTAAFSEIAGAGKSMPLAGVLFLLGGLALAGIPPTNGFVSKLALFRSGIDAEAIVSLSIIGAASIFTLVYVARAFQRIWWEPAEAETNTKPHGDRLLAPAILIGLCLLLGIWSEPLLSLVQATVDWLGNPTNYIHAVMGK